MSTIKIIGWKGNPLFKEYPAKIEREPVRGGTVIINGVPQRAPQGFIRSKLVRTLHCMTKDVQTVLQSLPKDNATISVDAIGADGTPSSVSYGTGWTLLNVDETSLGSPNVFSQLVINYTKEEDGGLLFTLPEGLTLVCENGVCTLAWLGETLEVWDSGYTDCGPGFEFGSRPDSSVEITSPNPWYVPGDTGGFGEFIYTRLAPAHISCAGRIMEIFTPGPAMFDQVEYNGEMYADYQDMLVMLKSATWLWVLQPAGRYAFVWRPRIAFVRDLDQNRILLKYGTKIWKQWELDS
jgi:hypothetical protein